MSLATVYSRARLGLHAPLVTVEVHLSNGLPGFSLVGLPETTVRESKDRVRAAIISSGFSFPARRITVNLAPADLPKEGGRFDLPIAVGILAAAGEIDGEALCRYEFMGELSLGGALRPVSSAFSTLAAMKDSERSLILPAANAGEAACIQGARCYSAHDLLSVCAHLAGAETLPPVLQKRPEVAASQAEDLLDVRGQQQAKRALEIAAAGGHHLLFVGPPGSGKSMLAARLPGVLPVLDEDEAIEVAAVQSLSRQGADLKSWGKRPFRSPHHTASAVALAGGGSSPRPGEISLAHRGVLFLDELPEFSRQSLEVLREPLESGEITISRASMQAVYPARFQLMAAMNPCPCGWWGDSSGRCSCTLEQMQRYVQKISGPLMDRIDMQLYVRPVPRQQLSSNEGAESSASSERVRSRVVSARRLQHRRQGRLNAQLLPAALESHAKLAADARAVLDAAMDRMHWSARAYHRVIRVARTIADMADETVIQAEHIAEAMTYRQLDRIGAKG